MSEDNKTELKVSETVQRSALGVGTVLLKNALDQETQVWLANWAINAGKHPEDGWYTPDGKLNATPSRGRIYLPVDKYGNPDAVKDLCIRLVKSAKELAPQLPDIDLTHLLLLWYSDSNGMIWHRDSDPNDGDNDHPIVSISLGNSCVFGYKPLLKKETEVVLESGDVLIWGGPERMLLHCVKSVNENTTPDFLPFKNGRINFTYRSARNILGKEDQFKTDKYWVDPN